MSDSIAHLIHRVEAGITSGERDQAAIDDLKAWLRNERMRTGPIITHDEEFRRASLDSLIARAEGKRRGNDG